jgi:hypothetical protein
MLLKNPFNRKANSAAILEKLIKQFPNKKALISGIDFAFAKLTGPHKEIYDMFAEEQQAVLSCMIEKFLGIYLIKHGWIPGKAAKHEKDYLHNKKSLFNFELKTTSGYNIWCRASSHTKKNTQGYFLIVYYDTKKREYELRLGWLNHSDWNAGNTISAKTRDTQSAIIHQGKY